MKEFEDMPSATDTARGLDRLVDGELNDNEQRQLLATLEGEPDGWRRCALAFIEAQTWRREFHGLTQVSEASRRSEPAARESTARPAVRRPLRWLALAAGLILAFTLGTAARGLWPGAASPSPETLVAVGGNDSDAAASVTPAKWQTLKVTIPSLDGGAEETVEVPLVDASRPDAQSLLADEQPVLSAAALKTLESTGHRVEQHRAYYPVQLEDGRRAVVPMDFVEVRYTGGWQ